MEVMMCRTLAEGSDGPESSGGVALPPVLRRFMAAICNNEAQLRPAQDSGAVNLDGGIPWSAPTWSRYRSRPGSSRRRLPH
eukprot:4286068-Alexandrium_andersonii.AAC.1